MRCLRCQGDLFKEETEFKYQDGGFTFIVKDVPAFVCPICGQEFFDEGVKQVLESVFEQTCLNGDAIIVRSYLDWSGKPGRICRPSAC